MTITASFLDWIVRIHQNWQVQPNSKKNSGVALWAQYHNSFSMAFPLKTGPQYYQHWRFKIKFTYLTWMPLSTAFKKGEKINMTFLVDLRYGSYNIPQSVFLLILWISGAIFNFDWSKAETFYTHLWKIFTKALYPTIK